MCGIADVDEVVWSSHRSERRRRWIWSMATPGVKRSSCGVSMARERERMSRSRTVAELRMFEWRVSRHVSQETHVRIEVFDDLGLL